MAKVKAEKTESSKTKKTEPTPEINLGDVILASINEQFKTNNYKAAFHLTDPDVISDVTDWVSTGCSVLDLAIANKPNCGLPVGRITEITGLEQSGKSLLAAHVLANTQKKNLFSLSFRRLNIENTKHFDIIISWCGV